MTDAQKKPFLSDADFDQPKPTPVSSTPPCTELILSALATAYDNSLHESEAESKDRESGVESFESYDGSSLKSTITLEPLDRLQTGNSNAKSELKRLREQSSRNLTKAAHKVSATNRFAVRRNSKNFAKLNSTGKQQPSIKLSPGGAYRGKVRELQWKYRSNGLTNSYINVLNAEKSKIDSDQSGELSNLKPLVEPYRAMKKSVKLESKKSEDYHYRTEKPMKDYKFTHKLSQHPRLRIRRPGESYFLRGNHMRNYVVPVELPQLVSVVSYSENPNYYRPSDKKKGIMNVDKKWPFIIETPELQTIEKGEDVGGVRWVNQRNGRTSSKLQSVNRNRIEKSQQFNIGFGQFYQPSSLGSTSVNEANNINLPEYSGFRSVEPPPEFQSGFGTNQANVHFPDFSSFASLHPDMRSEKTDESLFTGESALTPNLNGPMGDGYGPPTFPGAAVPPLVPAVSIGGEAAGIQPHWISKTTVNPPTTLKPSALFNILQKADLGFNQAMTHFEQGTPIEAAAIDILEVALGSQKLDSQARLLGHIDRAIGIDNLQRIQRWANTGGALDTLKAQILKLLKNYSLPEKLLPSVPPQLQYLFSPNG